MSDPREAELRKLRERAERLRFDLFANVDVDPDEGPLKVDLRAAAKHLDRAVEELTSAIGSLMIEELRR